MRNARKFCLRDSPRRSRTKREQKRGSMTSPRAATSTDDRTYVRRRNWGGEHLASWRECVRLRRASRRGLARPPPSRASSPVPLPMRGASRPHAGSPPQIDVLDIREARLPLLARALEDRVGPVSILSANEAKFRERSQRVKIQQKQSCKMNGAPIGGKTCGARPCRRAPPAGRNRATWTCGPRLRSQQRSAFGRSLMLTRPTRPHSRHKRD
jgi:hypothetical protein